MKIYLNDIIKKVESTTPTETPEQLALKANRDKIIGAEGTAKVTKTTDNKVMYDTTFDIGTFTYNTAATDKQKKYQDNILIPLEIVMNDKNQYKTLVENLADDAKKTTYE